MKEREKERRERGKERKRERERDIEKNVFPLIVYMSDKGFKENKKPFQWPPSVHKVSLLRQA